ncbi:Predicted O-methyltransferase YrrM [Pustulibacterium marinum]|uniref:Predicted O-methyltransferase YrrM n=1 Tax=Pustulibacterium marinum TaxID=1224947 RepID=A0A1I7HLZ2_9FLAO|nr:class I SAM-dependent methyltransferase [Pustulibacterium marinum]SFU61774.1 Predicted O-methyltransferase YrrM [Pustulibacterium marinum]
MNWHLFTSYFKFLKNSTNQHGVHSPFIYDLVTKCFYNTEKKSDYQILKKYKTELLSNKKTISVTDFGAGSKVFKSNKRSIHLIAKNAGISSKRAKLLYRLTEYFQFEKSLELGTSLGIATAAIAAGNKKGHLISLEGCPETAKIAKQQLSKFHLKNIAIEVTEFTKYLQNLENSKFDFIYFDGNHQKEPTLKYFELLLKTTHNDTVWIFDDIHWSKEMSEAWNLIQKHPNVTVTIDTFFWGLVFFRKEQRKENFTIRL